MPVRTANAEWHGNLKEGTGTISTETGTLKDVAYNFVSRFEQGDQTNPEELLVCTLCMFFNGFSKFSFRGRF
ncbi:MAG: hypothetical protein P8Z35_24675 [Ignavibacteriaceae bacterium]